MFIFHKKYIHQHKSYYHVLQQNIPKTIAEKDLFYADRVKKFTLQKTYQLKYRPDHFLQQSSLSSWKS